MSCNRCFPNNCSCGLPGVPQPYCVQSPTCPESHAFVKIFNQFDFGILIKSAWNIPVCGGSAALQVEGVRAVPTGAVIWAKNYGYFEITAFDYDTQILTITNNCHPDNAAPGTSIPGCTVFTPPTFPPCCDGTQSGVFVKYDFTAPPVDDCIDIIVTSVDGLVGGNNVQIGTGIYRLNEVKANNVINICNQGEGITPDTPIVAQNVSGQYQYPVTSITVNGCSQDSVEVGVPLVCDEGLAAPLGGGGTGDILQRDSSGRGFWSNTIPDAIDSLQDDVADIEADITTIQSELANLDLYTGSASDISSPVSDTINSGTPSLISDVATVIITNGSATKTMQVHYTVVVRLFGNTNNCNTDQMKLLFNLELNVNGGGYSTVVGMDEVFFTKTDGTEAMDRQFVWHGVSSIAPSAGFTLDARFTATWSSGGSSEYIIDNMDCSITALGVAV